MTKSNNALASFQGFVRGPWATLNIPVQSPHFPVIGRKILSCRKSRYERAEGMRVACASCYDPHLAVRDFPVDWALLPWKWLPKGSFARLTTRHNRCWWPCPVSQRCELSILASRVPLAVSERGLWVVNHVKFGSGPIRRRGRRPAPHDASAFNSTTASSTISQRQPHPSGMRIVTEDFFFVLMRECGEVVGAWTM